VTDLPLPNKAALRAALLAELREQLEVLRAAQRATHEGATHEEMRPEGIKDMRSTEVSYLARGQAERVVALMEEIALVERMELRSFARDGAIALSALVAVESEAGATSLYWLAPAGGGVKLSVDGEPVTVVTPKSPLGRALLGASVGDEVELVTAQGLRVDTVMAVS
jgi:hypothetical protein